MEDSLSSETHAMLQWLKSAIRLPQFKSESWQDHDGVALRFLTHPDSKLLLAYMTAEGDFVLLAPYSMLSVSPKTFQYFVKRESPVLLGKEDDDGPVNSFPLTMANIRSRLQMGFVNGGGVDSLMRLMSGIFMPPLRASKGETAVEQSGPAKSWPESVRRDFLGQAQR